MANLREALHNGRVTVRFTKADNSIRTMVCTTNPGMLAGNEPTGRGGAYDENQVRVFDLEKGAWRSFKIDSVIDYTV